MTNSLHFQRKAKKLHLISPLPLFFTASTNEFIYPGSISMEAIVFICLVAIVLFNLAFFAWEYHKLQKFRKYLSPGNTVKVKMLDNEIYIATVKSRPGKYIVCVTILKDLKEYMVHSNRIYTL